MALPRHSKADLDFADDIVAFAVNLSRYEERLAREMSKMYDELSVDLRKLLDAENRQPGKLHKMKKARMEKLLVASRETVDSYAGNVAAESPATYGEVSSTG